MDGAIVSVVVAVFDPGSDRELTQLVRYCDACRRWGRVDGVHLCGANWAEHLGALLAALEEERAQ